MKTENKLIKFSFKDCDYIAKPPRKGKRRLEVYNKGILLAIYRVTDEQLVELQNQNYSIREHFLILKKAESLRR